MNTELALQMRKEFEQKQISKYNFIKEKANEEIQELEYQLQLIKEKIKEQKSIIKSADKNIENYSL